MRKETRIQFNAYLTRLGELYGVEPMEFATTKVDIEPAKAQQLESKIQESAAFLKKNQHGTRQSPNR
uniref:Uncharacterized protein n=1 Tax=Arsenophonus endosymbiont of Trialeurodes vaporariorum TaxID=235567 RepID=A0A3B0M4M2_9GAMM